MLQECLDSLLNAPESPDEVLVYDDHSDTPAAGFTRGWPGVRVIRSDVNRGPAYGRNLLTELTGADYVHFQDADDLFAPQFTSKVRAQLIATPCDLLLNNVSTFSGTQLLRTRQIDLQALQGDSDLVRFCLTKEVRTQIGTIRREPFRALRGFDEAISYVEDFEFFVRLAQSGCRYAVIDEPLVHVRSRKGSYTSDSVPVCRHLINAVRKLSGTVGPRYKQALCEIAAGAAASFHCAGAWAEYAEALHLARSLGRPKFHHCSPKFALVARILGIPVADYAMKFYQGVWRRSGA